MPYYDYCKANGITPFIDLNGKGGRPRVYKDDITIGSDGIPLCSKGFPMKLAAVEPKKNKKDVLNIAALKSLAKTVLHNALAKRHVPMLSMAGMFTLF